MHWESIASGICAGSVTNAGNLPANDAHVYFCYSTALGDTALGTSIGSVAPGVTVVVHAPAQITRGEARFPDLAGFTYTGLPYYDHSGQGPAVHLGYFSDPCLVGSDSARVWVRNDYYGVAGLAYHVLLNVETSTGVTQVPLRQFAVGPICSNVCDRRYALGCTGWGDFHLAVRDSAGIKLLPRIISMHWESSFGVADSVVLPDPYYGYNEGQYGVSGTCGPE